MKNQPIKLPKLGSIVIVKDGNKKLGMFLCVSASPKPNDGPFKEIEIKLRRFPQ